MGDTHATEVEYKNKVLAGNKFLLNKSGQICWHESIYYRLCWRCSG